MALFGPPKPDKFAQVFVAALREAGDTRDVQFDADEFRLLFIENGEVNGVANLHNFYDDYCATPKAERAQCLRHLVKATLSHLKETPKDFDDAKHDLRPKIWTRCTFEKIRLQQELEGGEEPDIPMQAVGEHLVATLVYDLPEAVHTIGQAHLDEWGVSFYEAMEIARRNLEETEFTFAGIGEDLYGSATGDTYDASRLLLLDLIRQLGVNGNHVAMVPNRDTLLITGIDDEAGLVMVQTLAEKALEEDPRPMVATPLRLDGDEWVDWSVPPDHPLYKSFASLELKWLHQEYADQKELLDALDEKNGTDIFVASYSAIEKKDTGDLVSYCVWSDGVEALLPQTQKVLFLRGEDLAATASWDKVQEIVGGLMEQTEAYPARYRVTSFPSDELLAALGNEEL